MYKVRRFKFKKKTRSYFAINVDVQLTLNVAVPTTRNNLHGLLGLI